jgi:hypothetical protein
MFYVSYFFECAALLAGFVLLSRLQHFFLEALIILLLITVINEGCSYFGVYRTLNFNKNYAYEVFFIIQSVIFYLIFNQALPLKTHKQIITAVTICLISFQLLALILVGFDKLNPYFLNFVCIHMIFIGFMYYYYVYNTNKIINIYNDPFFWIATGLVLVNFIHLFFVNATLIKSFANNPSSKSIFKSLNTFGNILYYSLLIYAFICSSKFQKGVTTS